jgi:hypothetical protein
MTLPPDTHPAKCSLSHHQNPPNQAMKPPLEPHSGMLRGISGQYPASQKLRSSGYPTTQCSNVFVELQT